ncbi:hypothetical protein [Desulfosporosinus sp.]|uniref:hypothetical protein n=1 Tax=Desulfosporosinus sp. TaxID=157907 RepID=UPI0025C4A375|nr:hypothetical protein [Desulfosporosinus sp.]MBC2726199.1 hypothetical protein [Desulfosporosinus sp.]
MDLIDATMVGVKPVELLKIPISEGERENLALERSVVLLNKQEQFLGGVTRMIIIVSLELYLIIDDIQVSID